jgi:hypothetical protein
VVVVVDVEDVVEEASREVEVEEVMEGTITIQTAVKAKDRT